MTGELRICLVANKFPLLGQAASNGFLWPIARGLAQNHEVIILSYKNPQGKYKIQQDEVTAFYLGHRYQFDNFQTIVEKKFHELHKEKPFHIVHSIDNSGIQIGHKKHIHNVAVIYNVEAIRLAQIFDIMGAVQESIRSMMGVALKVSYTFVKNYFGGDRSLLKTASGVFVSNPKEKFALERHYLYPEVKIFPILYGVEVGDFSPREKPEEIRKKLGIPGHARVVLTVTDMKDINEIKNLFYAFEKVAIKKRSLRLVVLGHGPHFKSIERTMLDLALGSRVIFVKPPTIPTDLLDYMALADVFVNLSSRISGIDPTIVEAMAQKKVVIASEFSSIATMLEHGTDGFLISPTDMSSLSNLLMDIFTEHISILQIGEQARKKAMNLFDTKKMVEQTVTAYRKTLLVNQLNWKELFL